MMSTIRIRMHVSINDLIYIFNVFRAKFTATLLPIRTVGVQGDGRTYSYAVGISCTKEPSGSNEWNDLMYFARLIPRVCHNINRVTYIFGGVVEHPVSDVTPTMLTPMVISTLRQADHLANQVNYYWAFHY